MPPDAPRKRTRSVRHLRVVRRVTRRRSAIRQTIELLLSVAAGALVLALTSKSKD